MDLLEHARHVMEQGQPWVSKYGLWIVAGSGFGQAIPVVGSVVPGLAVNLAAGYYCAEGALNLPPVGLSSWLGLNAGLFVMYAAGRWIGTPEHESRLQLRERLSQALDDSRWLPLYYLYAGVLRVTLPYIAGIRRARPMPWFTMNAIGTASFVALQVGLGVMLRKAVESPHPVLYSTVIAVFLATVIFTTFWLTRPILRKPRATYAPTP